MKALLRITIMSALGCNLVSAGEDCLELTLTSGGSIMPESSAPAMVLSASAGAAAAADAADFVLRHAGCVEMHLAEGAAAGMTLLTRLAARLTRWTAVANGTAKVTEAPDPESLLRGRLLRASAFGVAPYVMFNGRRVSGVDPDLFGILGRRFGFRTSIRWGRFFGSRDPASGEWNGVIGDVRSGEADVAMGALIATDLARNEAVDFTYSPYPVEFHLVAAWPRPAPPYLNILAPFGPATWAWLAASLVAVSFLFSALQGLEEKGEAVKTKYPGWLVPYRALMSQDVLPTSVPSLSSLRPLPLAPLLLCWLAAAVIVPASFSGQLNAHLVATRYEGEIDDEADLVRAGKYVGRAIIVQSMSGLLKALFSTRYLLLPRRAALYTTVATSPLEIHKKLLKDCHERDGLYNMQKGWLPAQVEEEGLMSEDAEGVLLFPVEPVFMRSPAMEAKYGRVRSVRMGHKAIFSSSTGYMLPKGSPLKRPLDDFLGVLVSMGFVSRLRDSYYPPAALAKQRGHDDGDGGYHRLAPDHFLGGIFVALVGFGAAAAALAAELYRGLLGSSSRGTTRLGGEADAGISF